MAKIKKKKVQPSIPYDLTADFWVTLNREYSENLGKFYTEKACPVDPQGVLLTGSVEDDEGNQVVVAMKFKRGVYLQGMITESGTPLYYLVDRPEDGVGVNRVH